jgi:hypothetical protein
MVIHPGEPGPAKKMVRTEFVRWSSIVENESHEEKQQQQPQRQQQHIPVVSGIPV